MSFEDLFRVSVCLGLLAVAGLVVATMKPRLYDDVSKWLTGYVFIITLSAFLGTASRIGSNEPLVWYGAPMRAVAVVFGLMYIWNARKNHTIEDISHNDDGFAEHPSEDGLADRMLKLMMPNGTVMRRWIALGVLAGILMGTVSSILIERVNRNSYRTEQAVCAVLLYIEQQLPNIQNPGAKVPLQQLSQNMRKTGVHCPPVTKEP